jgi:hypothetical protein
MEGVFYMLHYLAAATIAATTLAATPGKVQWQADYGKALAATRSDHRPLLVVLDNPTEPQAHLDDALLKAEGEQGELLGAYQLCRVDATTEYGKKVAKAFGASQLPHTAIIDRTGSVVLYRQPGQIAANDWSATLAKYQSGVGQTATQTYYRGSVGQPVFQSMQPVATSPSYCPSCQRRAMGM